jgi:hypothetical protein
MAVNPRIGIEQQREQHARRRARRQPAVARKARGHRMTRSGLIAVRAEEPLRHGIG